ncbi:MAG: HAD family hydrolase [Clostridia bacterium]|nr:HAD family hydrolase [Clostridia bacterium]NCD02524.1 HAD family hydrolase [Clostridia bacterium]
MGKIIFLDVDGTLVDFDGRMPESAKEALNQAREAGHHLVLCTGRLKSQIYPEVLHMKFDGIIASAGAYVECNEKLISRHVVENKELQKMIECFEKTRTPYCFQTGEGVVVTADSQKLIQKHFRDAGMDEEAMNRILVDGVKVDNDLRIRMDVEKAAYYDSPESIEELQEMMGPYFKVETSSYEKGSGNSGEITRAGVNKATGIREYVAYIGGRMEDTVAVGDGPNDVEMIAAAAISVAMGNASEDLKELADFVTTDVKEDGIKKAFQRLGIIGRQKNSLDSGNQFHKKYGQAGGC